MATEFPAVKERYEDYKSWLESEFGYEGLDAAQLQIAVNKYHAFQASDFNRTKNAERIAANKAAREERAGTAEERAAARELKAQERAQVKADREAARAAKAEAKATRDAEKGAAAASAPKKGRKSRVLENAENAAAKNEAAESATGEVEFTSEGAARQEETAAAY